MPVNRIVVLCTPIFAALAGWLTEWVAQHLPGTPNLDKGQLTALFIAGATFAFGKAALWLHGWQKHESYEAFAVANLPSVEPGDGVKHTGL